MIVKLLTEQHLKFLSLKEAAGARLSLHLPKYHNVGNHMSWLNHVGPSSARQRNADDGLFVQTIKTNKQKNVVRVP